MKHIVQTAKVTDFLEYSHFHMHNCTKCETPVRLFENFERYNDYFLVSSMIYVNSHTCVSNCTQGQCRQAKDLSNVIRASGFIFHDGCRSFSLVSFEIFPQDC